VNAARREISELVRVTGGGVHDGDTEYTPHTRNRVG
jgi:hypothetical protein